MYMPTIKAAILAALLFVLLSFGTKVVAEETARPDINVVLLLDQSDSTTKHNWREIQKQAVLRFIKEYRPICGRIVLYHVAWGERAELRVSGVLRSKGMDDRQRMLFEYAAASFGYYKTTEPATAVSFLLRHYSNDRTIVVFTTDTGTNDGDDQNLSPRVKDYPDFAGVALGNADYVEWYLKYQVIPADGEYFQVFDVDGLYQVISDFVAEKEAAMCPFS